MDYTPQQDTAKKAAKAMKKSGKLTIAVGGVILGALLLFFGNRSVRGKDDAATDDPPSISSTQNVEAYRMELEARITELCRRVDGVGDVTVVVMLDGGFVVEYATDKKITAGGESTSYVTVGSGSDKALVYITERPPPIMGIGVVCTGGSSPEVRREVVNLLSAAFGVGSNKIYVTAQT